MTALVSNQAGLHSGYGSDVLRRWQQAGTQLHPTDLVLPVFVTDLNDDACLEIPSLPGIYRHGINKLVAYLTHIVQSGLRSVLIFGVLSSSSAKDDLASPATDPNGPAARAIRAIKHYFPTLNVIADVCMCPYSSHGHCGLIDKDGVIINEASVHRIAEIALFYAQCGADVVAPSDMMDGRIKAIRDKLNMNGYESRVAIMSYSSKFASSLYGPFRDAAQSAPSFCDRAAYQLPIGSANLAVRASLRDFSEGADILMVKPAGFYLDIISSIKAKTQCPLAAYQVSGEYAMLYHAAAAGVFSLRAGVQESLIALKRSGADIIITYFAPEILQWISSPEARV